MKYFKIDAKRNAPRYYINRKTFENVTACKKPFEQRTANGKISQYGICPSCLNPIQIIGLSHGIKVSPYGKHTGKSIDGLPEWHKQKYIYCPYASCNEYIQPDDAELYEDIDQSIIELYELLREQFDRVVYIIQNELHIRCSGRFWKDALQSYVINRVYCYPWLSEVNLPYIFAYRGMQHMRCYGQQFENNTELYKSLSALECVKFEQTSEQSGYSLLKNREGCFANLIFRFAGHRQYAIDGEILNETMMFFIDNADNGQVVYECMISFDETYFINMINSKIDIAEINVTVVK